VFKLIYSTNDKVFEDFSHKLVIDLSGYGHRQFASQIYIFFFFLLESITNTG